MTGGKIMIHETYYMIRRVIKSKNGVTLLEMIVAIAIFSVAILSAMGIFNMAMEGQRSALAAQNLQESLRYGLEMMAKEVRVAKKDSGTCPAADDNKVYTINGPSELNFRNINNKCVKYSIENNRLKVDRDADFGYLTPDEVKINKLNFYVIDDGVNLQQSRVTVLIEAEAVGKETHKQKMNIQTTISSRYYE
jgi:prepilin-type N-terminal cleavage/methylation domain-containing protein